MNKLEPPGRLSLEGNVSANWKKWKQMFHIYLLATKMHGETEDVKSSIFLHVIGEEAVEIYNSFEFPSEADKTNLKIILDKFEEYCNPKKNLTVERHNFFSRNQVQGESIDQWITDLKLKSKSCEFETLRDSLIKDRIVCGVLDKHLKNRLLREDNLTLEKAITICHLAEQANIQIKTLENAELGVAAIAAVNKSSRNDGDSNRWQFKEERQGGWKKHVCGHCGRSHQARRCPASGKTCYKCNGLNHFGSMCRELDKKSSAKINNIEQSNEVEDTEDQTMIIGSIISSVIRNRSTKCCENPAVWEEKLCYNNKEFIVKIDTGAQVNVMSLEQCKMLNCMGMLNRCKIRLTTYTGEQIPVSGEIEIKCVFKDRIVVLKFIIISVQVPSVVGLITSRELGLCDGSIATVFAGKVSRVDIETYKDVFEGLGCLKGEFHISLKEGSQPVVHAPRRVPVKLRDRLTAELQRMERLGVITKVTEPTDWVNSMVIVEKKNKSLRICLDPRDLNRQIKRSHYRLPTVEEIASRLNGAQYFSILDASSGFWMIQLNMASSKLCTFNTPMGRFRFTRLPYGVSCAPEMFHRIIVEIFEGLPGVESYIDDILVWGRTIEEHDSRLKLVLDCAKQNGLKFNREKCRFGETSVPYLGHILTGDGLKIDKSKVMAVREMPSPSSKKELERFIGMVSYLAKFVNGFSNVVAPLRKLLCKDVDWQWNESYEKIYGEIKQSVASAPVLKYFDIDMVVLLSVDASQEGVGAVLMQEGGPVAYASKALTTAQRQYAQIEKEMYAIMFGCERFHQFVYGKTITVETDHKPLETLFKKPLAEVPIRLQRMMLRVQCYDLVVTYKPGKQMYVADALSRAYLNVSEGDELLDRDLACQVHMLFGALPVTEAKLEEIRQETQKEATLQKLMRAYHDGWPNEKAEVDECLKPYWSYRELIHEEQGIMLKSDRVIVPMTMRRDMLKRVHEGHLGIEKCKERAREALFWPGMTAQITDMVNSCTVCQKFRTANRKEPMGSHSTPDLPWQRVGSDLFQFNNKNYILVVDYFSKFVEICVLADTKSSTIIKELKYIFAHQGIPRFIVTDNGPQYSSQEFKNFLKAWEIAHVTSSPYHPQGNGQAERAIQTIKNIFKKCTEDGSDPLLGVLNYCNTPIDNLGSPAQMLMSRRLRSRLPLRDALLKPNVVQGVKQRAIGRTIVAKKYYDRSKKELSKLQEGEWVRIRKNGLWEPATVVKEGISPRSYVVQVPDGSIYRRNRGDLLQQKGSNIDKGEWSRNSGVDCELKLEEEVPQLGMEQIKPLGREIADTERVSSTGRVIRQPKWLEDYVTD